MAGDWIKMRSDLFSHPKVVRISSALKADTLRTVGGLMSVWCLFDAHSIDGQLEGYSQQTLDDHVRWQGFSAAMIAVGWLEESSQSLVLPEFETHNGQSAKRRAQDADRKKVVRKESASEADKKRTREEKRREDSSVPNGTAGKPARPGKAKSPGDIAKAELWRAAVSVLAQGGCANEAQARSFMGKLVGDYTFPVVKDAVAAAVTEQPADAREYLKGACQHAAGQRQHPNKQEALEQRNRAVADQWAAQGAEHATF